MSMSPADYRLIDCDGTCGRAHPAHIMERAECCGLWYCYECFDEGDHHDCVVGPSPEELTRIAEYFNATGIRNYDGGISEIKE